MKMLAALTVAAVVAGCSDMGGRWDAAQFPQQYVYDSKAETPTAAK